MTIHSISQIGSVLRNAVNFNFKNPPDVLSRAESLVAQTEEFFNLLESRNIDFVLANGIALLTYGEGRNTQDIDLIMALPSLAKLPEIKIDSDRRVNPSAAQRRVRGQKIKNGNISSTMKVPTLEI